MDIRRPPDRRTDEQRQSDRAAAAKQAARAAGRGVDQDLIAERAQRVIDGRDAERRANPRSRLAPLERLTRGPRWSLAVSGEQLVRADRLPSGDVRRLANTFEVPHLEGRLLVVRDAGRQPVRTSPHYAVPFGPVMKAVVGPEPASPVVSEPGSTRGAGPFPVAVIDTGVDSFRRGDGWLAGIDKTADNRDALDVLPPDGRLDLGAGHGTFVAGVVEQAADSQARITVYRALDTDGVGTEAAVASTMVLAAKDGAKVLCLSLGLHTVDDTPPIGLQAAVELIRERWPDVLMVAAAGNFGDTRPCWPAAFDDVTAVAALDCDLNRASWSGHGSWVDCSTIGEAVRSTFVAGTERDDVDPDPDPDVYPPDAWAIWSGTSFAAPQIVGAIAQVAVDNGVGAADALALLLQNAPRDADVGRKVKLLEADR